MNDSNHDQELLEEYNGGVLDGLTMAIAVLRETLTELQGMDKKKLLIRGLDQ